MFQGGLHVFVFADCQMEEKGRLKSFVDNFRREWDQDASKTWGEVYEFFGKDFHKCAYDSMMSIQESTGA